MSLLTFLDRRPLNLLVFLTLVLSGCSPAFAEEFTFHQISAEQGLSQGTIYSILEDSLGFMWFGTRDGLNKFDGSTFKTFRPRPDDSLSLSNMVVRALHEDRRGQIWVAGEHGILHLFERHSQTFRRFRLPADSPEDLLSKTITQIAEDTFGRLWLLCGDGSVALFNSEQHIFEPLSLVDRHDNREFALRRIRFLRYDGDSGMWLKHQRSLLRVDTRSMTIQRYPLKFRRVRQSLGAEFSGIAFDKNRRIWLGGAYGLAVLDPERNLLGYPPGISAATAVKPAMAGCWPMVFDALNNLWLGGADGLWYLNTRSGEIRHFRHEPGNTNSLSDNQVLSLHCSRNGLIWIGSSAGLNILELPTDTPEIQSIKAPGRVALAGRTVRAICTSTEGTVWIGTDKGVYSSDGTNGHSFERRFDIANGKSADLPVNAIFQDRGGTLWFGTTGGVLVRYNPRNATIRRYRSKLIVENSFHKHVYTFFEDRKGRMWLGTNFGVQRYRPETDDFQRFPIEDTFENNCGTYVFDIVEDRYGHLWLGGNTGIQRFDPETERYLESWNQLGSNSHSLSSSSVWSLLMEENGITLWIGTYGSGLFRFNTTTGHFKHFGEREGLPSNLVYGILSDDSHTLWLSTAGGSVSFYPESGAFRTFTSQDRLQGNEYYFGAYHRSPENGFMYMGGKGGIKRFHPDSVCISPANSPLVISGLRAKDSLILSDIPDGDTVFLDHNQNTLELEFTIPGYRASGSKRVAYRLIGHDSSWVYTLAHGRAVYENLDGGVYRFQVRPADRIGDTQSSARTVTLVIAAPLWKTTGFRVCAALFFLGVLVLLKRVRLRSARARRALHQRAIESELQALRLQMNPHFLFNSLNAIQHFILEQQAQEAYKHLADFTRLMRMVLEHSQQRLISLNEEIEMLEIYLTLEQLRFAGRFSYCISLCSSIDPAVLRIPPLLIQPFAENAITHGFRTVKTGGILAIDITRRGNQILCTIMDNGIGRAKARELRHSSVLQRQPEGMRNVRKRIAILEEATGVQCRLHITDCLDSRGKCAGTRVEIAFPADISTRLNPEFNQQNNTTVSGPAIELA